REFAERFTHCDFMLLPAAPTLPFRLGEKVDDPLSMYLSDVFTIGANLAGIPGLSVPMGLTPAGLPTSVQLLGPEDGEPLLLPAVIDGSERRFALTRIHCEEDAGKSFHPERHGDRSLSRLDFNRAGTPLLELVTEPVLRTPAECSAFLTSLRRLVRALGISGG